VLRAVNPPIAPVDFPEQLSGLLRGHFAHGVAAERGPVRETVGGLLRGHFAHGVAVERGAVRETVGRGVGQTLRSISFPPLAERV
jgi:hypothetical protein